MSKNADLWGACVGERAGLRLNVASVELGDHEGNCLAIACCGASADRHC
jgi:hypothetical protein